MTQPGLILDQDQAYDDPLTYRVFVEDEFRFTYDPAWFPTIEEVLDHAVGHIANLKTDGLKEWDLAIWQKSRLAAVILTRRDGEPLVQVFSDTRQRIG
jgi:hypothetical protein